MADKVNLSPEMIENFVNMLKNSNTDSSNNTDNLENNSTNSNSKIFNNKDKSTSESNINLGEILAGMSFNNNQNSSTSNKNSNSTYSSEENGSTNFGEENSSTSSDSSNIFGNLDFETILKIKSILETLNNKNDQNSKLLYSLKPYLRKNKQEKLDQYINLLKISQVSKLFK